MSINWKDNLGLGFLLGLIGPTLGIIGFYLVNYNASSFFDFVDLTITQKLLSPLLSLCCVINLALFYLFIHFEKYPTGRGIILATFLYGLVIVLFKFFI
ncbi:MAG: hypothetical protein MH472_11145 [Bacteroidia bacterium]|nr:hypothetical protein [Bacteroidia bacterium]